MNSKTRVGLFLLSITAVSLLGGYVLFDRIGLALALVLCTSFNVFVYFFASSKIQQSFGGLELEGQDAWGLCALVQAQAQKQNLKPPRVFLMERSAPQMLVVSSVWDSRLLVTRGLVESLSPVHLEALVAYHLTSVRLHFNFAACVCVCVCACVLYVTDFFDAVLRLLLVEKRNFRVPMSQAFSAGVAPVLSRVLTLLVGSRAQAVCDGESVKHLPKARSLAEALWHLQAYTQTRAFVVEPLFLPLLMLPVAQGTWAAGLQKLQPTRERIQSLVGHYPI